MREMSEYNEKSVLPDETAAPQEAPVEIADDRAELTAPQEMPVEGADDKAELKKNLLAQLKQMIPIIFGLSRNDPNAWKDQIIDHAAKLVKNPGQFSEDFWDSLFGTGADGISREDDAKKQGKIDFVMELPDPVRMPVAYSVAYHRLDEKKNEVVTLLERDEAGNIHFLDAGKEFVFVRTGDGFRKYPVLADQEGFGEWDGVLLSARSVRGLTDHFWKCADQTFIKWLGVERTEETEYLGRRGGLYHAEPGTITFRYQCDMVIDDETGICLCYTVNELLKGAVFTITEDDRIIINIDEHSIGGAEMNFYCTKFETENISFDTPDI